MSISSLTFRPRLGLRLVAIAALLCAAMGTAAAQGFTVNISFDEFGRGLLTNTNGFSQVLTGIKAPDPGPGGLASVLFYDILNPPGLVLGDLLITEPGAGPTLSDLLRFDPTIVTPSGTGGIFVYSDIADGVDGLADVGFPTGRNTNLLTVVEVGPEGLNGFTYTPTAGQPGFVAGAAGPVTYSFISDTPEPASVLLFITGGAGLLGLRFLRARG